VERKNRPLLDMARTMLDEYKTPDRFWAEAINTACYSINRVTSGFRRQTECEPCTSQDQQFTYTAVT
jgi:hypothetical protein